MTAGLRSVGVLLAVDLPLTDIVSTVPIAIFARPSVSRVFLALTACSLRW